MEREIVVPKELRGKVWAQVKADTTMPDWETFTKTLQAFAEIQAEHPPVPTPEQVLEIRRKFGERHTEHIEAARPMFAEWFRMAYAAPEPPPEIADLLWSLEQSDDEQSARAAQHNMDLRTLHERMKAAQKAGSNE